MDSRETKKGAIAMKLKSALLMISLFLLPALGHAQAPTKFYWTESYPIGTLPVSKANLNGTVQKQLCTQEFGFTGVAVDAQNRKMYLASRNMIERADLDGSNRQVLVTSINPEDIALDLSAGKMYWPDYTYSLAVIKRADLDGKTVDTLTSHLGNGCDLRGMAIHVSGGKIYWVERMADRIRRANLDGSGIQTILQCSDQVVNTWDVAIYGSHVYWTDASYDSISRADLDGDNVVNDVIVGLNDPRYMDIDQTTGKVYWASDGDHCIKRSNLDGSDMQTLVTGVINPLDVFLSTEPLNAGASIFNMLLLD